MNIIEERTSVAPSASCAGEGSETLTLELAQNYARSQ